MGKIALFYKFVDILNPQEIMQWQKELCTSLALKGRVLIAHHGINATLGGHVESIDAYKDAMNSHPLFGGIDFKESAGGAECFPRLRVVVRKTIVNMGIDYDASYVKRGGAHLNPDQVHEFLKNKSDNVIIFDGRNKYESVIGKFEGAIAPDLANFRDFPAYIDANIDQFKDKEVLMYCTGGIRCEPLSAYLVEKNVAKKVYQIEGGIHRYIEAYPDGYFKGKNYVFDGRVALPANEEVLSRCDNCPAVCDEYHNCLNAACNKKFIACSVCINELKNTCGVRCKELVYVHHVPQRPPFYKTPLSSFVHE